MVVQGLHHRRRHACAGVHYVWRCETSERHRHGVRHRRGRGADVSRHRGTTGGDNGVRGSQGRAGPRPIVGEVSSRRRRDGTCKRRGYRMGTVRCACAARGRLESGAPVRRRLGVVQRRHRSGRNHQPDRGAAEAAEGTDRGVELLRKRSWRHTSERSTYRPELAPCSTWRCRNRHARAATSTPGRRRARRRAHRSDDRRRDHPSPPPTCPRRPSASNSTSGAAVPTPPTTGRWWCSPYTAAARSVATSPPTSPAPSFQGAPREEVRPGNAHPERTPRRTP